MIMPNIKRDKANAAHNPPSVLLNKKTASTPDDERCLLAYLELGGSIGERIVSADEAMYLENVAMHMQAEKQGIDVSDTSLPTSLSQSAQLIGPFIVYGIIAPQPTASKWGTRSAKSCLKQFRHKYLQTVHLTDTTGNFETFFYEDFFCDAVYRTGENIPCAMLMYSTCNYPEFIQAASKDPDFLGVAMSPAYAGFSIADSILYRDFVIVIRDIEPAFNGNKKNWTMKIDDAKLIKAGKII